MSEHMERIPFGDGFYHDLLSFQLKDLLLKMIEVRKGILKECLPFY